MIHPRDIIPPEWSAGLAPHGPIALGHDIATTTKGTSNWSSLWIMQHQPPLYVSPLVIRWRTDDGDVSIGIIDQAVRDIEALGLRARRLAIDGSNEKFHAKNVARHFIGRVPTDIVVAGEATEWKGERYDYKTLLGNLFCAAFDDNLMAIPGGKWLQADLRLPKKESGRFVTELGPDGAHGDCFDAGKLAYWGLARRGEAGPGSIQAATVGSGALAGGAKPQRAGLFNPLAALWRKKDGSRRFV